MQPRPPPSPGIAQAAAASNPSEPLLADDQLERSVFDRYALPIYALLLLVSSVGNSVFFKLFLDAFKNYAYFTTQLTTFVYVPVFGLLIAVSKNVTPEMRKFPKMRLFTMGTLDSLSGLFMAFGGVATTGSIQALLLQALIPVTLIFSFFILRTKYTMAQCGGAAVILAGVCIVLMPEALRPDHSGNNLFLFNMIFLLCTIPQALSSVFKEIAFADAELDVNYLQYWVAIFQMFFGVLAMPMVALPGLNQNPIPLSQIPLSMWNGILCVVGIDSTIGDDCSTSWVPMTIYIMFNLLYNISIMMVIKHGSASLMYFVMTLRLPIVQIVFALPFIPGHKPLTVEALIGLIVILLGLGIYRFASRAPVSEDIEENIQLVPGGLEAPTFSLQRPKQPPRAVLHRNPQAIRSVFYSRLGLTGSPDTQSFKESFDVNHPDVSFVL